MLDWLRQWLGLPDEFSGVVYDTASISTMHALAVAREEASTSIRTLGPFGPVRIADLPHLRFGSGAQFGRESGDRARVGGAQCPPDRERFRVSDECGSFARGGRV